MKYILLIPLTLAILFLPSLSLDLKAQIEAPFLVCIDNDTLVWETPVNTCGTFRGYIIQASQDMAGPYAPLDTILNQNQTTYFHAAAGAGGTWYYYLESDFDCPGLSRLTSDTLDNRIPELGPLLSASVISRDVVLTWAPSPSPETSGYIIARNTSSGTTIIDTVYDQTTYTDFNSNAVDMPETYFVTAIDRCGNTSLVGTPHTTMRLQAGEVDPCTQSISFSWTPYVGWDNGVGQYEIVAYSNSEPTPTVVGSTAGAVTNYTFLNADKGETYCFTIRAVEAGGTSTATSNYICEIADVVQPIRELTIDNATVNENGAVAVTWRWNDNAQLTRAVLTRSVNNGPFENIHTIDVTPPLNGQNMFTDSDPPLSQGPVCYRIETTDECGAQATSNVGCTINVTAVSDGQGSNQVSWTPFDFGKSDLLGYELFRVVGGAAQSVGTFGGNETSFLDQVDLSGGASGTICYYVVANAEIVESGGAVSPIATRSNLACTEQSTAVYIPNAFAPNGVNTEFRAYLQFGDPMEYLLQVYDRWGNQVFQAQSIDQGWDGAKDGQDLPAGVYIYRLVLKQSNGNVIERAGSVALIR